MTTDIAVSRFQALPASLPQQTLVFIASALSRGVTCRLEDLLNALGACAGFACQHATRLLVAAKQPGARLTEVRTADGRRFYFGETLNAPLFGGPGVPASVWAYVAGGAQAAGATRYPDIAEIAAHTASTIGGRDFGVPRVAVRHQATELPIDALVRLWPSVLHHCEQLGVEPMTIGWHLAIAAQRAIVEGKDILEPGLAAAIVLEAAVPMSRIDPDLLHAPGHGCPNPGRRRGRIGAWFSRVFSRVAA